MLLYVCTILVLSVARDKPIYYKKFIMGGVWSWLQDKVMSEEGETFKFPSTLEEFGYHFNEKGELRHRETDKPFEFNVKEGDYHYNQQHYNALGEVITEKVYEMLEKECKLQRTYIPVDAQKGQPRSFVFISGDLYTNTAKLMIIVHGNGVVRAGQWARRLIINDSLDSGTQLPYIRWAREHGYSVIVANPNLNHVEPDNKKKKPTPIPGNSTPEEHMQTVWREFVQRCAAKHVAIVAHSYGGVSTLELAKTHLREFEERVFAIAFTDSVHALKQQEIEPDLKIYYKQHVKNWASAYDPLDAPLITTYDEVPTVSAGTDKHENTSYCAMHSIFKFIEEKYKEAVNPKPKDSTPTVETDQAACADKPANEVPEQTLIDLSEPSDQAVDQSKSAAGSNSDAESVNKEGDVSPHDVKSEL